MKALRQQLVREVRERIPRYDEYRHVYCLEDDNHTEFSDISEWVPIDPSTLPPSSKPCIRSNNNSDEENEANSDIDLQSTPVSTGLNVISSSSSSSSVYAKAGLGKMEEKVGETGVSAVIEMPMVSSSSGDNHGTLSTSVVKSSSSSSSNTVVVCSYLP